MGTSLNNVLGFDLAATVSNGNTSEQDANAALLELDKTLRSTKVGDQCEGIVRYARYIKLCGDAADSYLRWTTSTNMLDSLNGTIKEWL